MNLTEPKPDGVAFYPIYDFSSGTRIATSSRWRWNAFPKDSIVESFSRKVLQGLAPHGLESNTAGLFRPGKTTPLVLSDCICFPWLVVEHKKDRVKEIFCYCQAANAGTAAVMMLETLCKYAEPRADHSHVPPVTTMTTAGKTARVWITYKTDSCNDSTKYVRTLLLSG